MHCLFFNGGWCSVLLAVQYLLFCLYFDGGWCRGLLLVNRFLLCLGCLESCFEHCCLCTVCCFIWVAYGGCTEAVC